MSEHPGKVFQVKYQDKATIYNCYMVHTVDGGLFVPTAIAMNLGDPVLALISIPDHPVPFTLSGKVSWISHGRRKGFGLRFSGDEGSRALVTAVQNLLGASLASANATYTM